MREKKQKKNRKIHALLLAFGIGLLGVWNMGEPVAVYGAEESITSMDEEGNMKKVDSSAKLIENPAGPDKTRKGEPQVVNFRTKNNAVTEYIEQETASQVIPTGLTVQMLYIWDMQMENTSSCFPVLWAG